MKTFILSTMMLFFSLGSTAQAQGEAQELCIEETVNRCVEQCEKTNSIDCTQACQENAQNQCRQAGE